MINEKSVKPIKIKFKVPEKKKEKVATESIDALDFKIDKWYFLPTSLLMFTNWSLFDFSY